ncbi:Multidrug resistance protein fnx1 [Lachnellula cervina]|uniref:Multidrug resistance protein fnx1 n=1 Tax=Lachnellula cervina TaxID=1316786 RepID=A0A7D8UK84_9HELO|nr:Multidrug resistance protein fnx1 [Lachnellula cervina]
MAIDTPNGESPPRIDEETPLLRETPNNNDNDNQQDEEPAEEQVIIPPQPSTWHLVITLSSIYTGVFLGALDSTIIATLSTPISRSFSSLSLLSWLASAYLIANAACQPLSGRLTDIFSRRTGLLVSNAFFCAGNLICGLAGSEAVIILGRVVAGMGGGGLMAISTFVASDLVPLRTRGLVQGVGNVCYGSGAGLGGIFGGWINDVWGWRVAFLVQVPLIIISAILVYFFVNVPPKQSSKPALSRVDFLGAGTLVLTLVLLLLGLNSGGNVVPWTHPLVLVSLPLSGVGLALFVYIEAKVASEPIIPVHLLLHRTVASACLANLFTTASSFTTLFYIPIFFQTAGLSTTLSGLRLIPHSLGTSIGSLGVGLLLNHTGRYKLLSLAVLAIFTLGTGLLATLDVNVAAKNNWGVWIYMALIGTGYGGILTVTFLAVIAAVAHEHQAVITSATYAFRSTGSTIGVTVASAVYQNLLSKGLHERFDGYPGADKEIGRIRDGVDGLGSLPEGWEGGAKEAFGEALRGVFLTSLGVAVLGLGVGAFMREHVLHKTLERRPSIGSR